MEADTAEVALVEDIRVVALPEDSEVVNEVPVGTLVVTKELPSAHVTEAIVLPVGTRGIVPRVVLPMEATVHVPAVGTRVEKDLLADTRGTDPLVDTKEENVAPVGIRGIVLNA